MTWVRRSARGAGLAAFGAMLAGCGMPGTPLPPSLNLPVQVTDLTATRTGEHVRLTWTMPTKNTDKLLLKGKVQVRVCRKAGAASDCVPVGNLEKDPGAAVDVGQELPEELATGMPRPLTYYVELLNKNGRSAGMSNAAMVAAGEAPAVVLGLDAQIQKIGVVLHWNAALEGPEATAMRLQRKLLTPVAEPAAKSAQNPMTPPPEPVEQNLLVEVKDRAQVGALDKNIRFGQTYEYRAQRVVRVKVDGTTMELAGPLSQPVRVEAKDVFPPAAPKGLAAVAVAASGGTAAGIDLDWEPNIETDLAGYVVYRRESDGEWERVSPTVLLVGPGFHDGHVAAGHTYEYAVTAVDQNGHESLRSAAALEAVPSAEAVPATETVPAK
jgi:hypothetical protein